MEILKYLVKGDEFIFGDEKEKHPIKNLHTYAIFSCGGGLYRGFGVVLFFMSLAGCAGGGVGGGIIAFIISVGLFWFGLKKKQDCLGLYFNDEDSRFDNEAYIPILATKSMDEIHKEVEKIDKIIEAKGLPKVKLSEEKG